MPAASGHVDARFRPVSEAFLEGFEEGREVGATVAVVLAGTPVVNLWNGHTDRRRQRPWQADTLVCMFSVTKALTAVAALIAAERGLFGIDDPVVDHWPGFRGNGKEAISVRQLLSHRAGLIGFHRPVDRDIVYDWPRFVAALADESPWWPPGERHGYHARTFGFLVGEIVRRCTGRSLGIWLQEQIANPLAIEFYVGLPETALGRCADMLPARLRAGAGNPPPASANDMMRDFNDPSTPTGAAFQNPAMGAGYMNTERYRRAEIPAANGHGTALAVATFYDRLGALISNETLGQATSTHSLGFDEVLKSTTRFGLGLMLHHDDCPIGVRPGSFGHAGAGGSMAFHDPNTKVSFCYAMNQMEFGVITGGVSAMRVAHAVYDCL